MLPRSTPPAEPNPFEPTTGTIEPIVGTAPAEPIDPEAAANAIVDLLPAYIAEYAREMAYVYNRQPLWSLVAGHVLKAYENGDLQAPVLDPSWPRKFTTLPMDPRAKTYTCEWRDGAKGVHTFTPIRYKQRFCSNECGTAAAMAPKPPLAASA